MQINNKYQFISFEGVEGSGKSTQTKMLANALKNAGVEAILTREPGGTAVAEEIRNILINGEVSKLDGVTETLLNFAARRDHVEKFIKPTIAANKIVISDRFYDSTFAYQGFAYELDLQLIENIKQNAIGDFAPDITFLIDVDIDSAMARITQRSSNNRYEEMGLEFHQKVRNGFLEIAQKHPKRIKVINGSQTIEAIHQEIISFLQK
ncbi:MAG: dTMP kinase [Proteobacteria bacterium]|nr:dTMP kinase [Pseudomonadota bacterium]